MELQIFLKDWYINHAKHKDLFARSIMDIKEVSNQEVHIQYRDRILRVFIFPLLKDAEIAVNSCSKEENVSIITVNNQQNLGTLLNLWKLLIHYPKLNIFFVNTFSNTDKRWVIYPSTHQRIADQASLTTGLQSMYSMVEPIGIEEYSQKIKNAPPQVTGHV